MSPLASLTPEQIEIALEAMQQRGATLLIGGSRSHTLYGWGPSGGYCTHSDEGAESSLPQDASQLRDQLRLQVSEARVLLYRDARRRGVEALRRGDEDAVIAAIDAASAFLPMSKDDVLLRALLRAAQGEPVGEDVLEGLRVEIRAFTFWHIVMNALGWERSRESGEIGLALLERAVGVLGGGEELQGAARLRESFGKLLG